LKEGTAGTTNPTSTVIHMSILRAPYDNRSEES
jgi:hypothetical protein